ncbi:MAG TPA: hypothetical protein VHE13_03685 [Opitutus sp.]|nr:hypothetical protein [Opitutus sp.]
MKFPSLATLGAAVACLGAANLALGDRDSVVTAVFSRSFNNYERPVQADGSPLPLTYVMAKGGCAPGSDKDASIDDVKFAGIVRVVGKYLAKQGYYPAKNGSKADLMLVIHWGKTVPFNNGVQRNLLDMGLQNFALFQQLGGGIGRAPGFNQAGQGQPQGGGATAAQDQMVEGMMMLQFAEGMRYDADQHNANLLGYTADMRYRNNPSLYGGAGMAYYDLLNDLESERYYIAITAYDFQDMLQHQHKKGLWRTVASIDARDNRFDERLAEMVDRASHYFGKDSGRLVRQFEYTPHVSLGELRVLGVVDEKQVDEKASSKK